MHANLRGALFGMAAMGLYCLYDVAIKYLGGQYSPLQILFCAGLVFVPLILAQMVWSGGGSLRPVLPLWTAARVAVALVNGVIGAYAFAVLPLAQTYAVFFLMPLMISLLAVPFLREPLDLPRGLAILAGFVGVLVALQPGGDTHVGLGHLAAFAAASLGAVYYVILRKTGGTETPAVLMFYPALVQLVAVGLAMPWFWVAMTPKAWAITSAMGVMVFIGGRLIIEGYRIAPAVVVSPMQYSQIIWAAMLGWVLFGEAMSLPLVIGIAVIIAAGVFILLHRPKGAA
jgi:S-adenosylmethionine uptake transporter